MKIVFLGDSVTQGCFDIIKNEKDEWELIIEPQYSYVALLDTMLRDRFPDKEITVINAGISGDSTDDAINRTERDVLSHAPALTVVCLGLNDSGRRDAARFGGNMAAIFEKLQAAGSAVISMTPNMLNTYVAEGTPDYLVEMAENCADIQNHGEMDALIEAGKEAAQAHGIDVCDVYALWRKWEQYGVDTTSLLCNHINHPKREMHRLFADLLFPLLCKQIEDLT